MVPRPPPFPHTHVAFASQSKSYIYCSTLISSFNLNCRSYMLPDGIVIPLVDDDLGFVDVPKARLHVRSYLRSFYFQRFHKLWL